MVLQQELLPLMAHIGFSMSNDPNKIAAIEKAIAEKYGSEAVQNPKSNWNENKEKEYLEQSKQFYKKQHENEKWQEKVDEDLKETVALPEVALVWRWRCGHNRSH